MSTEAKIGIVVVALLLAGLLFWQMSRPTSETATVPLDAEPGSGTEQPMEDEPFTFRHGEPEGAMDDDTGPGLRGPLGHSEGPRLAGDAQPGQDAADDAAAELGPASPGPRAGADTGADTGADVSPRGSAMDDLSNQPAGDAELPLDEAEPDVIDDQPTVVVPPPRDPSIVPAIPPEDTERARNAAGPAAGRSSSAADSGASEETATTTERPKTHVIESGDTLADLAVRYYGEEKHWRAIADANPDVDPRRLLIGEKLTIPPQSQVLSAPRDRDTGRPENVPPAQRDAQGRKLLPYRVAPGETLSSIAAWSLGDRTRWKEIYELNKERIANPDVLPAGLEILVPAPERGGEDQERAVG